MMIEKRNIVEDNAVVESCDKLAQVIDAGVDQFMKKTGEPSKQKETTNERADKERESGPVS